ncbi:virulence factor Mce family protein [Mycolicibacterium chubuense NBB4]|uniref:Virulence factor Mce family protein n=1 Tax=Mycolicibacterium chubuense (strain NBB4) TaxID=710421 RepID=I4BHF2_MYCCN|nr:MCE family protein [Mycolicibacterium chubuense]AFM16709.1 virulence factor Mce family protein [Mycolicibacterium chubuense NBB4]
MRHRTAVLAALVMTSVSLTACSFGGVNSLPLPGTVGHGPGASNYTVQLANVGTLEANSPVMIDDVVVGSIRRIGVVARHAQVDISVEPGVRVPANATAAVGQTSLLGSMHLELAPPAGQQPIGTLPSGADIPLARSSSYPSTEQTLAALSSVVNAGGLGQIGDVIHSLNATFSGRETGIRDLLSNLDTFVGTLSEQRDDIIAAVTELNRFSATIAQQKDTLSTALHDIQPALDVLRRERPRLTAALDSLHQFSDTARRVISDVQDDLVTNLGHLGPTLKALADIGPDIDSALGYATIFPLNQNLIDRGIRGDYMNLFVTVDLTLDRFKRGLLAGTSFGDENAPLVPAPGDPGYGSYYLKNPAGEAVAPPPGVKGPDRLPPPPGEGGG